MVGVELFQGSSGPEHVVTYSLGPEPYDNGTGANLVDGDATELMTALQVGTG